jgi:Rrf2 family protein
MKLSASEEYGLRCLLQLARNSKDTLTLPELSRLEGLTVAHVGKIMRILRHGGLVKSVRGQSGGYALSRAPEKINLKDVLNSLGGQIYDQSFCDRHSGVGTQCVHTTDCSIRSLLSSLQVVVDGFLHNLSLKDLLPAEKEASFSAIRNLEIEDSSRVG